LCQGDALLAAEVTRSQQCDSGFSACPGDHAEPDAPALDVKNVFSQIALGKGTLFVGEMNNRSAQAAGG